MDDIVEIDSSNRVACSIHWTTLPPLVSLRALVGNTGVTIDFDPQHARSIAEMLLQGARKAEG